MSFPVGSEDYDEPSHQDPVLVVNSPVFMKKPVHHAVGPIPGYGLPGSYGLSTSYGSGYGSHGALGLSSGGLSVGGDLKGASFGGVLGGAHDGGFATSYSSPAVSSLKGASLSTTYGAPIKSAPSISYGAPAATYGAPATTYGSPSSQSFSVISDHGKAFKGGHVSSGIHSKGLVSSGGSLDTKGGLVSSYSSH